MTWHASALVALLCVPSLVACDASEGSLASIRSVDLVDPFSEGFEDTFEAAAFLFASEEPYEEFTAWRDVNHLRATLGDVELELGRLSGGSAVVSTSEPIAAAPFFDSMTLTIRDDDEELSATWPGLLVSPEATIEVPDGDLRAGQQVRFVFEETVQPYSDVVLVWRGVGRPDDEQVLSNDVEIVTNGVSAAVPAGLPPGPIVVQLLSNNFVEADACVGFIRCEPADRRTLQEFELELVQ
jgi:hypothetical protein